MCKQECYEIWIPSPWLTACITCLSFTWNLPYWLNINFSWAFGPSSDRTSLPLSLLRSVEESSYAHSHQLLHREPFFRGRDGHHHLPAREPCGRHHRDVVLWEHSLQSCPLPSGNNSCIELSFQTGGGEKNWSDQ